MPAEPSAKGSRRTVRIGQYTIEAPLAFGSLGSAYRAVDSSTGRTVALKVLPPELTANPTARERFLREARRAAKVRSAGLVNVLDCGDASGTWFLALELAQGETLREYVQRHGTLDADRARQFLVQAARTVCLLQREGLVPRDLSAGNFRVTGSGKGGSEFRVKLLDLGLLRFAGDDATGDVRAALAALGGTAFFLLTGRTGRKPDLAALTGDVSDELRAVLRRLLAQRPEERYQTPAALLEALGEEEPTGPDAPAEEEPEPALVSDDDALASLDAGAEDDPPPRKPIAPPKKRRRDDPDEEEDRPMTSRRTRDDDSDMRKRLDLDDEPAPRKGTGSKKAILFGAIAFGAVLLVGGGIFALLYNPDSTPPRKTNRVANNTSTNRDGTTDPGLIDTAKGKPDEPKKDHEGAKPVERPGPPPLYASKEGIHPDKLIVEFSGPSAVAPTPPKDTPVFRVARLVPAGAKPGTAFDSIAAACAAIPEGKWGIIEVQDDGPIFQTPIALVGRSVEIRGGYGFAPLIVWDTTHSQAELKPGKPSPAAAREDGPAFLSVDKGSLVLNNVHLAVDWPEKTPGPGCLVRVSGGNFLAWESTFSQAGKSADPIAAVRFAGGPGHTCRLRQCCLRGTRLTALDVPVAGADVMIDGSLLLGGPAPLLSLTGAATSDAATTLRVLRSTLLVRDKLLQLRPGAGAPTDPAFHWMGWDVLLWRAAESAGGVLVDLPKDAGPKNITWRAVNSLYAGFETLLSGREPLAGSDIAAWHSAWNIVEGDVSESHGYAKAMPLDPAEAVQWFYNIEQSPLGFAATYGTGVLGCDVWQLPWIRNRWLDLTTQLTRPADVDLLPNSAPNFPESTDLLLYSGERLDLNTVDLGAYLRDLAKRKKLAPTVVMHLHGTGHRKTSPVRVDGVSLFLYFEPPAKGADPLVLEPDTTVAPDANTHALFEVNRGNLSMVGADVRCPDYKLALMPRYLVGVRDGNCYLSASRLQGPLAHPPPNYGGLIRIEGMGLPVHGTAYTLSINECSLLSARQTLYLAGAGLRTHLQQSLVVATDRAVAIQLALPQKEPPGEVIPQNSPSARHGLFGAARLNMELTADHATFAGRESAVFIDDIRKLDAPGYVVVDPVLVQTRHCAFLNPFAGADKKPAPAVLLEFTGDALRRGLLAWQGDGDAYDKRLYAFAQPLAADGKPLPPDKPQPPAVWERLWGPADQVPNFDATTKGILDPEKPALDQLRLPASPEKPGADLVKLLGPRKGK